MRAKTWGSEQEQQQYGGAAKEEVFQVMHKATIQAIHETHGSTKSKKAHVIYQRAQRLVQSIVEGRYRVAGAESFDTTWVAPGFVQMAKGKPLTAAMWNKKRQAGADSGRIAEARPTPSSRFSPTGRAATVEHGCGVGVCRCRLPRLRSAPSAPIGALFFFPS